MAETEQLWNGDERRKTEREELVHAVICAIREEANIGIIPPDKHFRDHEFVGELIAEMRAKRERKEELKAKLGGGIILGALSSIATGTYHLAVYLKDHWKP